MSWLRLDDRFAENRKVVPLGPPATRWAWLEVLLFCARNRTGGIIEPDVICDAVTRATPALLQRAEQLGLIDRDTDGTLRVHDWDEYNGTLEDRVRDYLAEHPDATSNDVARAIGGTRKIVLAIVARIRREEP